MGGNGMAALVVSFSALLLLPAGAWGQSATTASIAGVVRDATGAYCLTSGVHVNIVPKTGGNTFKGYFFTTGNTGAMQQSNLTDELRVSS
jgi:hypothetical protein